jgi:hypothetical protein
MRAPMHYPLRAQNIYNPTNSVSCAPRATTDSRHCYFLKQADIRSQTFPLVLQLPGWAPTARPCANNVGEQARQATHLPFRTLPPY